MGKLILMPVPRKIKMTGGNHIMRATSLVLIKGMTPDDALNTGTRLSDITAKSASIKLETVLSTSDDSLVSIFIKVLYKPDVSREWYRLNITRNYIDINASHRQGVFHAMSTLAQIIRQHRNRLPCLMIEDYPDFPVRGVMLDISRSKVPAMETLKALIDMLAEWKINHLQLYTEHTFAYQKKRIVWDKSSPMTAQEIMYLDNYCRERYIELVPNQNSFGHFERWLKHPLYAHLADEPGKGTLCPTDKRAIKLLAELYDELLPHFRSRLFNVGCDETQIGKGRSKALCKKTGEGRVYFDYLMKIYELLRVRDKTMMFWGDIIMRHPELVKELPKDIIALEWGYEAQHPFKEHGEIFAASGIPFYVCPGTSSWNSVAGRTDNCIGNLINAAENGLCNGATGFLITDWGDCGHWQYLPVSYIGFGFGASLSWSFKSNKNLSVQNAVSIHAFKDKTGNMGRLAYELGNAGTVTGLYIHNDSPLFNIMQFHRMNDPAIINRMPKGGLEHARKKIENAMSFLSKAKMESPDADLVRDEFLNAADLLRYACLRGEAVAMIAGGTLKNRLRNYLSKLDRRLKKIIKEHKRLWLARNRIGGLDESLSFMTRMLDETRFYH